MRQLTVSLAQRSYPIYIGQQMLDRLPEMLKNLGRVSHWMVITDPTVDNLYGSMVVDILASAGLPVTKVVFPGGEEHKTLTTIENLGQQLLEAGMDRRSAIIALGGGIVGDVAGFTAAVYMRGIPFVQIPTTLLAQVDSSVGGKTGVNLTGGKNLMGAFYQPRLIFINTKFLNTLNEREYRTGLAEVIKYAIIKDQSLFDYLEANRSAVLDRQDEYLQEIIYRCCQIKSEIVAGDERESGERALLNLGHTFGHAIETLSHYKYNHGEAVAAGMVYAARLAYRRGLLSAGDQERISQLISGFGLPVRITGLDAAEVVNAMYKDKKSSYGSVALVLPTRIGQAYLVEDFNPDEILSILAD